MSEAELRMDAYYYGFTFTGVREIDMILSAVACAGKAYHHTDNWSEETPAYEYHEGATPVDWIQNAADKAAAAWNRYARSCAGRPLRQRWQPALKRRERGDHRRWMLSQPHATSHADPRYRERMGSLDPNCRPALPGPSQQWANLHRRI